MPSQFKLKLRPETSEDQTFLKEVFFSSLQRAFAVGKIPPDQQKMLGEHQFAAQATSYRTQYPNADYDIVLLNGEPAGRIYIDRHQDDLRLMEMTLLPRFQNHGVGTLLIEELLKEAQEHELPVILHVEHWNPDARRLYLRLGFHDEEDIGTHWRMRWEANQTM